MARALTHTPHFRYIVPVVVGVLGLTPHEKRIVRHRCVDDMPNKAVAAAMGVAENTIKNEVTTILRKTGHLTMNGVCYEFGEYQGAQLPQDAMRAEVV